MTCVNVYYVLRAKETKILTPTVLDILNLAMQKNADNKSCNLEILIWHSIRVAPRSHLHIFR